jgi:hypothetical protein
MECNQMSLLPEPFETQNVRDDDGSIIDSFLIETDSPPDLKELNEPIIVKALREPAPITRLFTTSQLLEPTWEPFPILPADANRTSLILFVYSATEVATDGVRFSDDPGTVRSAGRVLHNCTIDLSRHTGPLWVIPCGNGGPASASVTVEYWSVTE